DGPQGPLGPQRGGGSPSCKTGLDIAPIKSKIPSSKRIFLTAFLHRNWIYAVENDCFPELGLIVGENFPRSEIGTRSARMSALDDLLDRSLRIFAGLWGKFHYLYSLRENSGRYEHWGFVRTQGEVTAQAACAAVHTSLFSQIPPTPLAELLAD